jgi:methyl halide transferase
MTDWQTQYATGETPWDRGTPAPALLDYLSTNSLTGRVLIPGCGTGQDVKALAASEAVHAIGLDIAPLAVERAQRFLADTPRASVQLGDLFADCHQAPLAGSFDYVWEHTCYCAIPPDRRPDYVEAIAAALKPGGTLIGVFFLTPWDEDEDQTQGPPFGTGMDELIQSLAPRFDLIKGWRPQVAYPGREGKEWCGVFMKR